MDMTPHFPIYMDYGATTPCDPRVVDAMIPWLREAGLPKCSRNQGIMASTTRGSQGLVAL